MHIRMARLCALAALFLGVAFGSNAGILHAAETPIPPSPAQGVTDTAGFMSPGAASALNAQLEAYQHSTGHQLIVYIGKTTGGAPIDDWAVRAFEAWRVGRKGIDDGLALFIMSEDRRLRFEVGYGLEATVTDALASRVINDVIAPRIRAGDQDGAVSAGMDAIMTIIGGGGLGALPPAASDRARRAVTLGQFIVFAIVGLVILVILATNPSLALFLLASILSGGPGHRRRGGWGGGGGFGGGGWGGGGFGGGGFGGGGGRSGGGGASGSW
jgi:uncharacterized protein